MKIAILGAGAGGAAAAVECTLAGHEVRLWNRSASTLEPFLAAGGVHFTGVLGEGHIALSAICTDLKEACDGADGILVCLPTLVHANIARALADAGLTRLPVVLNPGHTGGALEMQEIFRTEGKSCPPLAEFSTLTYVARKPAGDRVSITGRASAVRVAALPGGRAALDLACRLYDSARPAANVLATALSNVNMVLHPPGAILGAAWVEETSGDFTFYVQGLGDGVARVMERLDDERRAVAAALGLELPSLLNEMKAIGTIEATARPEDGLAVAVRGGVANASIKAPDSLAHRYYKEDLWYGLQPFLAIARIAGVDVPTTTALLCLGKTLAGEHAPARGRDADTMGITGLDARGLLDKVKNG